MGACRDSSAPQCVTQKTCEQRLEPGAETQWVWGWWLVTGLAAGTTDSREALWR